MNVQEKFKIIIVQMSCSPELCSCNSEELRQREKEQCNDILHEIITHYKNNQVNAWFTRKMRAKRDAAHCWFDQKLSDAQLNILEQDPPFTWRSEQTSIKGIDGYICHLVDEDYLPYGKEAALPIIICRGYLFH